MRGILLDRIRRVTKKCKSKLFELIAWQRVSGRGTYLPLKSNEIKYFYALIKEERREKSLKTMIKYLKIMIQYKSKENFRKKASSQTSDLIPNADPTKRCCKFERVCVSGGGGGGCRVGSDSKCMELAAAGWCTRKW